MGDHNPYQPPSCDRSCPPMILSGHWTGSTLTVCVLAFVQLLTGFSTAAVVSKEGIAAHGFFAGMTLFTIVVTSLVVYATGCTIASQRVRCCLALSISTIAWGSFLLGLWSLGRAMTPPAGVAVSDLPRFAFMTTVTAVFAYLTVRRLRPEQ